MADPRTLQSIILPPPSQRDIILHSEGSLVRDVQAYPKDLSTAWINNPKHRFLFIVEITMDHRYVNAVDKSKFALLAQTVQQPAAKYTYTEFNEYGIRKGALTKTEFDPVDMTFFDDNENYVLQFFTNVSRLMSPISNMVNGAIVDVSQYDFQTGSGKFANAGSAVRTGSEQHGGNYGPNVYAVSSGPPGEKHSTSTSNSSVSLFETVKIHHVHTFGAAVTTFTLMNPRILQMAFNGLDMASGENGILTMKWGYDYFTTKAGPMTHEISKLVGPVDYTIRPDL